MESKNRTLLLIAAIAILAVACGGGEKPGEPSASAQPRSSAEDASAPRPAATVPLPRLADAHGTRLPEGHPPVGGPAAGGIAPPPPGAGAGDAALRWTVPEGWVREQPASTMRKAQYRVPGPGGDGECVVFYFGPGQGGDPMSNAMRWAGQFAQPDGRPTSERLETSTMTVGGVPVLQVEVAGTYDGGMTMTMEPAEPMPGYMLLGAIAEGPDANWFFKFTGPEATVRAQRAAFQRMLRSLKTGT